MYKVNYAQYHIAKCENFEELLAVLKEVCPLVSYASGKREEYDYDKCVRSIRGAAVQEQIRYCTREQGFRAKVAELLHYFEPVPEELGFMRAVSARKGYHWAVPQNHGPNHNPCGEITLGDGTSEGLIIKSYDDKIDDIAKNRLKVKEAQAVVDELKDWIDVYILDDFKIDGEEIEGSKLAREKWGKFTYITGHQPTTDPIQDDPYWSDDALEHIEFHMTKGGAVQEGTIKIAGREYEVFVENDCGFTVIYAQPELANFLNP